MNRRKFLKKTSSGFAAAAFLPLLSFDNKKIIEAHKYQVVDLFKKDGKEWLLNIILNPEMLSQFKETRAENREIEIDAYDTKLITMIYKAQDVEEKIIGSKNLHFITLKMMENKMNSEASETAENMLGKEIMVEIHDKCHAVLVNKKKNLEINFKYKDPTEDGELDCFLTTACVAHKNLPDNCYELNTLRKLREYVMMPNEKYKALIEEYDVVAPKMLLNINKSANKEEILEHIYTNLVLPSVTFLEAGKNEEAINYYADYVSEMKNIYL
ncbi:hypothetical protein [Chryseobacterium sp. MP_3.2]|uniref:hypothetical protein n=1 Tax=Chryseobacterium sp. MP_3.2 TaxID=3071712 RepID=UPI002E0834DE|nr:hypothetical protein [Chryseobacterium sp. MP_3.2]